MSSGVSRCLPVSPSRVQTLNSRRPLPPTVFHRPLPSPTAPYRPPPSPTVSHRPSPSPAVSHCFPMFIPCQFTLQPPSSERRQSEKARSVPPDLSHCRHSHPAQVRRDDARAAVFRALRRLETAIAASSLVGFGLGGAHRRGRRAAAGGAKRTGHRPPPYTPTRGFAPHRTRAKQTRPAARGHAGCAFN